MEHRFTRDLISGGPVEGGGGGQGVDDGMCKISHVLL